MEKRKLSCKLIHNFVQKRHFVKRHVYFHQELFKLCVNLIQGYGIPPRANSSKSMRLELVVVTILFLRNASI